MRNFRTSFIWFSEKQRSLANSIAIGSMFINEILLSILLVF
jgi:hypothetical protein